MHYNKYNVSKKIMLFLFKFFKYIQFLSVVFPNVANVRMAFVANPANVPVILALNL